jgi:hypothetical protein
MKMKQPVFFLGIVRSGTSFMGQLLTSNNSNVYITHESDIIWILYSLYELGLSVSEIEHYKWDGPSAMKVTIDQCKNQLHNWKNCTPAKLYDICQHILMKNGTRWQKIQRTKTICLGDKKPMQQSDPDIFKWTEENFTDPKPKYIHLLRHPNDFLGSTLHFGKTAKLWGETNNEIMNFWVKTQRNVLKLTKDIPERVITVKYEDVCEYPRVELERIYEFLDVPVEDIAPTGVRRASSYEKIDYDCPRGYITLMKKFKYKEK